ncbi:hypothetical protein BD626DRAFT_507319, partial [Schizophyllum amplum]
MWLLLSNAGDHRQCACAASMTRSPSKRPWNRACLGLRAHTNATNAGNVFTPDALGSTRPQFTRPQLNASSTQRPVLFDRPPFGSQLPVQAISGREARALLPDSGDRASRLRSNSLVQIRDVQEGAESCRPEGCEVMPARSRDVPKDAGSRRPEGCGVTTFRRVRRLRVGRVAAQRRT